MSIFGDGHPVRGCEQHLEPFGPVISRRRDRSSVAETAMNLTTGPSHSVLWSFSAEGLQGGAPSVSGAVPWFYKHRYGSIRDLRPDIACRHREPARRHARDTGSGSVAGDWVHRDGHRTGGAWRLPIQLADLSPNAPGAGWTFPPSDGRFWTVGFGAKSGHDGDAATLSRDIRQKGGRRGLCLASVRRLHGFGDGRLYADQPGRRQPICPVLPSRRRRACLRG